AVIMEPVQGEAGVRDFPAGYLAQVRSSCTAHGALLIFDEIQSGIGRTGTWFGFQNSDLTGTESPIVPDATTLAKGLGAGMPIGSLVTFGAQVSRLICVGGSGTTFGGIPLATARTLPVSESIETENLLANVNEVGE